MLGMYSLVCARSVKGERYGVFINDERGCVLLLFIMILYIIYWQKERGTLLCLLHCTQFDLLFVKAYIFNILPNNPKHPQIQHLPLPNHHLDAAVANQPVSSSTVPALVMASPAKIFANARTAKIPRVSIPPPKSRWLRRRNVPRRKRKRRRRNVIVSRQCSNKSQNQSKNFLHY